MWRWLKRLIWVLVLLIGLALVFHKQIAFYVLSNFQPKVSQQSIKKADKQNGNYNWAKVDSLSAEQILKARLEAGKINFIGYVAIPEIGLNVPISRGVDNLNISLGAGTLKPKQVMGEGNFALASHFIQGNSGRNLLFSPIYYSGKVGQKIYLTDLKQVYEYTATVHKIIDPTDVSVVDDVPGQKLITLITCNYTADNGRVLMQGRLDKSMSFKDAPKKLQHQLASEDNRWIK
ncbi:sortase [Weissella oryzae SG25]|uniref:Sortase n=1 Tax=Weissella oryzae (strain DSM 25784 / JCM 18191 / LMG 30913 / SG25) TaxID=1329250 RepID=A0A069CRI1_WEIOS|nr:class A sortase [Weissella oryzae]GAK30350.1 sortase [Weissella oryzae SG25]